MPNTRIGAGPVPARTCGTRADWHRLPGATLNGSFGCRPSNRPVWPPNAPPKPLKPHLTLITTWLHSMRVRTISCSLRRACAPPSPTRRTGSRRIGCSLRSCRLRLAVIAHNVLQALKRLALPAELLTARPKRLRFLLFNMPGRLVHHARRLILRVAAVGKWTAAYGQGLRLLPVIT